MANNTARDDLKDAGTGYRIAAPLTVTDELMERARRQHATLEELRHKQVEVAFRGA